MTNVRFVLLGTALACLMAARPAQTQAQANTAAPPQSLPAPAHISVVDGTALIEREGRADPAVVNVPVVDGDRLRTESGRLEVVMPDGSTLQIDESSSVDLLASDLLRLNDGRLFLIVAGADDPARAVHYQVDAPAASVQVNLPGEYRISLQGDEIALEVVYGDATFATDTGSVQVRAGERSVAGAGGYPSSPQYFNAATEDAFDRWSHDQRDARLGQQSAQYLPQDLQYYAGTFDRYGTWSYDDDVRKRLVSGGVRRLAALLRRLLGELSGLWLGLDRCQSLVLADPSLRPMGHLPDGTVVLDSRFSVGAGLGVLGREPGLRRVVSARMEQLPGVRDVGREGRLRSRPLRPVAGVDGHAKPPFRTAHRGGTRGD